MTVVCPCCLTTLHAGTWVAHGYFTCCVEHADRCCTRAALASQQGLQHSPPCMGTNTLCGPTAGTEQCLLGTTRPDKTLHRRNDSMLRCCIGRALSPHTPYTVHSDIHTLFNIPTTTRPNPGCAQDLFNLNLFLPSRSSIKLSGKQQQQPLRDANLVQPWAVWAGRLAAMRSGLHGGAMKGDGGGSEGAPTACPNPCRAPCNARAGARMEGFRPVIRGPSNP